MHRFFTAFVYGEEEVIAEWFPGPAAIDTPLSGAVDGRAALGACLEQEGHWWREHTKKIQFLSALETDRFSIAELVVDLDHRGNPIDLPITVLGQKSGDGFGQIRLYHSTWPLQGNHTYRAPIVWPGIPEEEPDVIRNYFEALENADAARALALFSADAYVREPSGSRYRHEGPEELKHFYEGALAMGGIGLTHATTACDGKLFAVEFICDSWGPKQFDPMAGCAIYELTADQQHIRAVRIYDDVTPPTG